VGGKTAGAGNVAPMELGAGRLKLRSESANNIKKASK
jgi:hypothetical protein